MELKKLSCIQFLCLIVLTSCSLIVNNKETDQSFLTDQPCKAPCWYGLTPGQSEKSDVQNTLKSLSFIDQNSIKENLSTWKSDNQAVEILFGCTVPKIDGCGGAVISQGRLVSLRLSMDFRFDFETIVNKLGQPSYVDYGIYHPEAGGCVISVDWPEIGVSASYIDTRNDQLCRTIHTENKFPQNVSVENLYYFTPDTFSKEPGASLVRIDWPGFIEP